MRSERLLGFLKKVENPMAQTGFISYTIFLKYPKAGHGLSKRPPPQETPLGFPLPDITILLSGIAVCFLAGVLGGLSGAGTGLVIAGFLVPIVGAKAVMPALAIIMLINNGSRIFFPITEHQNGVGHGGVGNTRQHARGPTVRGHPSQLF
jgi:hypothetical protein